MRAREGFVLASDLHLVYLVTPINVDVEPDWELYYERYMQLSSLDQVLPLYLHFCYGQSCKAFSILYLLQLFEIRNRESLMYF